VLRAHPPKPSGRQRLHDRVYAALERASVAVTGDKRAIGGVGGGGGRLTGYCPVCLRSPLTVEVIGGDPPRVRQDGCSGGCPPHEVARSL
jgi:hypothetical protein